MVRCLAGCARIYACEPLLQCEVPYDGHWERDDEVRHHCPNLVVRPVNHHNNINSNENQTTTVPVTVQMSHYNSTCASLVDMWWEWNRAFYHNFSSYAGNGSFSASAAPPARATIRLEDLLFHPRAVTTAIDECIHGHGDGGDGESKNTSQFNENNNDDPFNLCGGPPANARLFLQLCIGLATLWYGGGSAQGLVEAIRQSRHVITTVLVVVRNFAHATLSVSSHSNS
ncbi:hypothetical protein ACA910_015368 [Epithemia clementina (nom. ined.)]